MKRSISLLSALLICFSVIFSMTACDSDPMTGDSPITTTKPKHPIEQLLSKTRDADSVQMTMTMYDLPIFGTITMVLKHDGNIEYTSGSLISKESYTETINGKEYKYSKTEDGKWVKTLIESDESDNENDGNDFTKLLENPENFEAVEGKTNTYKQKSDVVFDEVDDVTITIEEDSCTIEMMMITEDLTCRCVLVISHIGEIELTLPEVTE